MRLVLLGPPRVGECPQAELIKEHFNIPHISTGDMLPRSQGCQNSLGAASRKIHGGR